MTTVAVQETAPSAPAELHNDGWIVLNDSDLADAIYDAECMIRAQQAKLEPAYAEVGRMRLHLLERLAERSATAVPHDSLVVELKQHSRIDKRISELRALVGLVAESELAKGLYEHTPAPEWKADARFLTPLAKKYGGEIAKIIARGLVRVVDRTELIIKPREEAMRNVSPSAIEGGSDG